MADRYALCVENAECDDLETRKIYQILPDEDAAKEGYLRVIDESREDYLYPQSYFVLIRVPPQALAFLRATSDRGITPAPHTSGG